MEEWKLTSLDERRKEERRRRQIEQGQFEEIARRFGENVRRQRRKADLSQEQLAKRANLHRTEIGLIERGKRVGRIETLIKLAAALEVPADVLIDGIDWVVVTSLEVV